MIEVKNLSCVYREGLSGGHTALFNINLTVRDGETAAIIGHTGSGKSTLIQHFNGLIKPQSGQVLLDGTDIEKLGRIEICRKVGLVFQYPEQQLFEETVYEDIAFGPKNLGLGETEINERVTAAAAAVGLETEKLKKSPFELSGGEKRRAAVAGVLAMKPKTLVLDEPMAGLDPRGRRGMLDMIKSMRKSDMTVVFVSHSMEDVAEAADRVIVLNEGRIDMDGSVFEVFSQGKRLEEIGLDIPQIMKLTEKLRSRGFSLPGDIYTAREAAAAIKKLLRGGSDV